MYEMAARLYCLNKDVAQWMREQAPLALYQQCQVLLEAMDQGRWQAKHRTRAALSSLADSLEAVAEESGMIRA